MNTGLKKVHAGLFATGLLAVAAAAGWLAGSSPSANAAAPAAEANNGANALSVARNAPLETWTNPINVSNSGLYDNTPWVGVSKVDGSATVGWERRDPGGNRNYIMVNSNVGGVGSAFTSMHSLAETVNQGSGAVHVEGDHLGRRHVVWWQYSGPTCGYYARIETNGQTSRNEIVPDSCGGQKNVSLAVGTDNQVHAIFGRDAEYIRYYRFNGSNWTITNENVPIPSRTTQLKNIAIGVNSVGLVMVAYVANGPAHSDVWTTFRVGDNQWTTPQDISASVSGSSWASTHLPNIDADPFGNLRVVWSQATRQDSNGDTYDDVFYREWLPTGWSNQIFQLTNNAGNSYGPVIAVDYTGQSHIVWADDSNRNNGNFQVYYEKGSERDGFRGFGNIFPSFASASAKDPAVDVNPPILGHPTGNVHITFGWAATSPKENYYSYAEIIPSGPTPTPTATFTPTFTPTPCPPGVFQDVHPTDYFYTAVTWLATHGVISGYGDCTFRPYNSITRGQAAKIVVIAAGLPTPVPTGTPTFRDVPATNPFYLYIEAAYHEGIISGYNCGGPFEPCPGLYFRWGNNITRGQFSKMVVLAFGFPINVTGGPHFRDVPTTNAFYTQIETAYNNGLISGYNCGGAGEPCPGLYFRPNAGLVRGQAAKIVYGAITLSTETTTITPTELITGTVTVTETPETATPTVLLTETPTGTPTETPIP